MRPASRGSTCPSGRFRSIVGSTPTWARFRWSRVGDCAGEVLDFDGTPQAGATIECQPYRHVSGQTIANIGPKYSLTTDQQGRFETPSLPTGDVVIYARASDRRLAYAMKRIRGDGEETLSPIRLDATCRSRVSSPIHMESRSRRPRFEPRTCGRRQPMTRGGSCCGFGPEPRDPGPGWIHWFQWPTGERRAATDHAGTRGLDRGVGYRRRFGATGRAGTDRAVLLRAQGGRLGRVVRPPLVGVRAASARTFPSAVLHRRRVSSDAVRQWLRRRRGVHAQGHGTCDDPRHRRADASQGRPRPTTSRRGK